MSSEDKESFYKKATSSDATPFWYGPAYSDHIPQHDEFFTDWKPFYFNDNKEELGRCFHIIKKAQKIGMINYNHILDGKVDIDIIIYNKENWSSGYGTSAIKLLSLYLSERFHVKEIWIDVLANNLRAIKAYEKADFERQKSDKKDFVKMVKSINQ
jgi:RimJ/RimL family protein N-acetyltransferase